MFTLAAKIPKICPNAFRFQIETAAAFGQREGVADARDELADAVGRVVDRLDPVVEVEGLTAASRLALQGGLHELLVVLADVRADRPATFGWGLDHGDVP